MVPAAGHFRNESPTAHSLVMHAELARIATEQEGLLTSQQIESATSEWVRRRFVEHGWIERVAPRVYAIVGTPDTHRRKLRLGLLSLGPQSWVSYEAAAALHGLDRPDGKAVEFTIEGHTCRPHLPFRVHTTASVPPIDRVDVDGFAATSATRTVIDLAHARRDEARVAAAIDSAVRLGLSSPDVIARRLETLRGSGRWGCRLIDGLLEDAGGHTMLERRFLRLVRLAELPRPRTQVVHRKGGRHIARVDFLFDQCGVVVEVSGQKGHSSPTERARDAQRRNELQDVGRRVFEYTWDDVTKDGQMVVRTLRARLGSASPALSTPPSTPTPTPASPPRPNRRHPFDR